VVAAAIALPAVFFAVGGDVGSFSGNRDGDPVGGELVSVAAAGAPCCWEFVSAAPAEDASAPVVEQSDASSAPGQLVSASRFRIVDVPSMLPVGVAPEQGLQIKTILAARSISAAFPEIRNIGGVRPDALRWHPDGLALDVMIPNPDSAEGIALGDEIVAFVLKNAGRFGLQDAIWRGTYYTPDGAQSSSYGHYDHVHITTTGGGYPDGGEAYFR
jgi:hypothetical protein